MIDGSAIAIWTQNQIKYTEQWQKGALLNGTYYSAEGKEISRVENSAGFQAVFENQDTLSLFEYQKGDCRRAVKTFNPKGQLVSLYHIKDGHERGRRMGILSF